MFRFFCFWHSTIVSHPLLTPPFTEFSRISQWVLLYYQESSNRLCQGRIRTCDSLHQHIVKAETPCSSWDFYTMFRGVFPSRHLTIFLADHARIELAAPDRQSRMLATTPMDQKSHFKTIKVQLVCMCCSFHCSPTGNRNPILWMKTICPDR